MIIIDAGFFYCGVVLTGDYVTKAPPIVRYMRGWHAERVLGYARSRRWKTKRVP